MCIRMYVYLKVRDYAYMYVPLKNESKWSNSCSGKGVPVDNKHIVAHSTVERSLSDDVHTSIAKLQRNHCYVWL